MSSDKVHDVDHLEHPSEDVPKLESRVPVQSELAAVLAKEKPGTPQTTLSMVLKLTSLLQIHGHRA